MESESIVKALLEPAAYAGGPESVELLETHISWLFFAGERVYKVKKPLRLPFLDYSTLERRRFYCEEEVRLNRRLAASTYLGVAPVAQRGDEVAIGGGGETVEWAVEMRRLPAHRMLDRVLERGEIDTLKLSQLAELLSRFHRTAGTGPGIDEHGDPGAVRRLLLENLEELREACSTHGPTEPWAPAPTEQLTGFLEQRLQALLERLADRLARRVAAGRVREGHGDLHAGNICFLESGPLAYDCIEFSLALRCGDVASDLAFLAMDLDFRGYRAFSRDLVRRYAGPANDQELDELMPLFKSHRAAVRAKVGLLSASQAREASRAVEHRRTAARYLHLAVSYHLPPLLVLTCGLPGTGKSTAADHLVRTLGASWERSDVRRKALAGVHGGSRPRPEDVERLYGSEMTRRTYASLAERAADHLRVGRPVVVDATFSRRTQRERFARLARDLGRPWLLVHATADEGEVARRLARRAREGNDPSDADLSVYRRARCAFEAPTEIPARRLVTWHSEAEAVETLAEAVLEQAVRLV